MNSQPLLKKFWSVIWLTATTVLLLTTVFATGAMAQESEEYSIIRLSGLGYFDPVDVDEPVNVDEPVDVYKPSPDSELAEPKFTLDMKLRALNPATCIGTSLWLEVEITNIGKKSVKIGKHEVWAYFSHGYHSDSVEVVNGETYFGGRGSDYFVLADGESYRDKYEFSLKDNALFENADKYTLSTIIESVRSNEVTFELCDCSNTKEEAN